eukprot:PLAT8614.1.p1 GENE.PLAT8614.1~~PLAT8614.1.p1  ORF type:complete len:812 (+),score=296.56 PLAT8614.1:170-2437(+)
MEEREMEEELGSSSPPTMRIAKAEELQAKTRERLEAAMRAVEEVESIGADTAIQLSDQGEQLQRMSATAEVKEMEFERDYPAELLSDTHSRKMDDTLEIEVRKPTSDMGERRRRVEEKREVEMSRTSERSGKKASKGRKQRKKKVARRMRSEKKRAMRREEVDEEMERPKLAAAMAAPEKLAPPISDDAGDGWCDDVSGESAGGALPTSVAPASFADATLLDDEDDYRGDIDDGLDIVIDSPPSSSAALLERPGLADTALFDDEDEYCGDVDDGRDFFVVDSPPLSPAHDSPSLSPAYDSPPLSPPAEPMTPMPMPLPLPVSLHPVPPGGPPIRHVPFPPPLPTLTPVQPMPPPVVGPLAHLAVPLPSLEPEKKPALKTLLSGGRPTALLPATGIRSNGVDVEDDAFYAGIQPPPAMLRVGNAAVQQTLTFEVSVKLPAASSEAALLLGWTQPNADEPLGEEAYVVTEHDGCSPLRCCCLFSASTQASIGMHAGMMLHAAGDGGQPQRSQVSLPPLEAWHYHHWTVRMNVAFGVMTIAWNGTVVADGPLPRSSSDQVVLPAVLLLPQFRGSLRVTFDESELRFPSLGLHKQLRPLPTAAALLTRFDSMMAGMGRPADDDVGAQAALALRPLQAVMLTGLRPLSEREQLLVARRVRYAAIALLPDMDAEQVRARLDRARRLLRASRLPHLPLPRELQAQPGAADDVPPRLAQLDAALAMLWLLQPSVESAVVYLKALAPHGLPAMLADLLSSEALL